MYKFTGFTEKANKVLNSSVEIAENLGHTFIGSEHLMLGLLREDNTICLSILNSKGLRYQNAEPTVKKFVGIGIPTVLTPNDFSPRCKLIIETALYNCQKENIELANERHLLLAMLKQEENSALNVISELGVSAGEILIAFEHKNSTKATFSSVSDSKRQQQANKSKTQNLDKYGQDLTDKAFCSKIDPVIAREKEIERVIQILARRSKNNPCLIGEPGVGKTAIAEGLALKISMGEVPEILSHKKIVSLDLTSMVAGTKYRGDFEDRIKKCIDEVQQNRDIILFIDEVHNLIGTGSAEGAVDAANILKPSLARSELQVIGATTLKEYTKHIEKDSALERRFQPVQVDQPSEEEAVKILKGIKVKYENHHNVKISDESLIFAVKLSARYINDRFLPDKAIDLIDEACSRVRLREYQLPPKVKKLQKDLNLICDKKSNCIDNQDFEKAASLRDEEKELIFKISNEKTAWKEANQAENAQVTNEEIAEIVSSWTGIPVVQITKSERERLLDLEKVLHETIVGQDKAVSAVSRAIRRCRSGIKDPKKPLGSFLFLGPTGVGKTQLCKALALAMFADENALIRFDMSEFMQKQSLSRLIGSPPGYVGYEESGQLTQKVRRKPYSIILFDELEKAHPDVLGILLQILDDGQLTDSQGVKVSFLNTVIIMTSNIGAKTICNDAKSIGFSQNTATLTEMKISDEVFKQLKENFKPEFLNRIDETIVFHKLSQENIEKIAEIALNELIQRLKSIGIKMQFSHEILKQVSSGGFSENYGARALKREIQIKIEDNLSEKILSGELEAGKSYFCDIENGEMMIEEREKEAVFL